MLWTSEKVNANNNDLDDVFKQTNENFDKSYSYCNVEDNLNFNIEIKTMQNSYSKKLNILKKDAANEDDNRDC